MDQNFYKGKDGLISYLNPHGKNFFPLVELPSSLNPFYDLGIHIYVKIMCANPLMNIKMLPAWSMLEKANLSDVESLVEYSSGNTVSSLAILAKYFGVENVNAIITEDVPLHKKAALRLYGANIIISKGDPTPKVDPPTGGIEEAIALGKKDGYLNLNQYQNEAVLAASEEFIGKELHAVLGEDINTFCASIGTSGTIYGASRYLKQNVKDIYTLASAIERGESIPGPRGKDALPFLGFPWSNVVDEVSYVVRSDAYSYSHKLIKAGLLLGPSSGMQYFSLLRFIEDKIKEGKMSDLLTRGGNFVFLGCDTAHPYIDDYFMTLNI